MIKNKEKLKIIMNDLSKYWDDKWFQHRHQEPNFFATKILKEIKKKNLSSVLNISCGALLQKIHNNRTDR